MARPHSTIRQEAPNIAEALRSDIECPESAILRLSTGKDVRREAAIRSRRQRWDETTHWDLRCLRGRISREQQVRAARPAELQNARGGLSQSGAIECKNIGTSQSRDCGLYGWRTANARLC